MRGKLDKKANVGVLVGYSEVTKGFKVYNLETKKLVVTRDVKIDENAKWDWNNNDKDNEEDYDLLKETIGADLEFGNGVRGKRSKSESFERCNVALSDLTCVQELLMKKDWKETRDVEMEMIEKNEIWSRARFMVKCYAQQAGVDYGETFAPVARTETIRLILALLATKQWKMFHLDVKSQAPKAWYGRINGYLLGHGFRRSQNEPTLYMRIEGSMEVVFLYVDDLLVTSDDTSNVHKLRYELEQEFKMSSLDSDWAGCIDDMRSTWGYSRYGCLLNFANQCIWLKKFIGDLDHTQDGPTIKCDNTSTVSIAEKSIQHGRTKHIPVKYHSSEKFLWSM
nr:uncharacterized protein LOC107421450 [Ziziphus jujuba var. spinosa]